MRRKFARGRERLRERPAADFIYRVVVAVVGGAVLLVGILAIPIPGPGWVLVFVGLGILATEFHWARRLLKLARVRYNRAMAWFRRQRPWVKALGVAFSAAVAVVALWLAGAIGGAAALVGVEWAPLKSPISLGR